VSGQYKVAWLCEALLVSRSGYYDWIKRRRHPGARQLENSRLRQRIREEFMRSRQTYGSPRLARVLGYPGRRNRIARLMRLERLFARQRSKYRVATTDSRHGGPIAPNRVQGLVVRRPNQVWTTDATCVLTGQGWLYLVAVLDVFSRRVTLLSSPSGTHSNTNWSITTASAPSPTLAPLSSITSKLSTTPSDSIPVLPIKAQSTLNTN